MGDNIVKTEVILSEDSVHKIIVSETGKALAQIPNLMETLVKDVLFHRPPKKYSYDDPRPTFYESVIQNTLKPMIEEEVKKVAEAHRKQLSGIIKKAFKTTVINNKEFEDRLLDRLAKFSANISFYVKDE